MHTLDDLLDEAAAVPVEGWDFSWFAGRATEERPPWGYARLLTSRLARASAALDLQTGGGEVLRESLSRAETHPSVLQVTESWPPNAALATAALAPFGATVTLIGDDAPLPFADGTFDLVSARHPVVAPWPQIARVLRPGGSYFAQHVGAGTASALTDFMMGPQPVSDARSAERAVAQATAAGLRVDELREATLRLEFFDVAAVAVYLRKVIWIVPGFSIPQYRSRLLDLHELIAREGSFVAHTTRYLIACSKI